MFYPSAEDGVSMTLEDIRDRSIAKCREAGPLAQRYALQAIRAMTSLQDYLRMDAKIVSNLTEEVRRQTIEDDWRLMFNISYYYWNDMLKKIPLSAADSDEQWIRHIHLGELFVIDGLRKIRDREVKAQELLRLQLRLEIVQNYRGTSACKYVLRHCDEYLDWK